jgi:hypothetical protein
MGNAAARGSRWRRRLTAYGGASILLGFMIAVGSGAGMMYLRVGKDLGEMNQTRNPHRMTMYLEFAHRSPDVWRTALASISGRDDPQGLEEVAFKERIKWGVQEIYWCGSWAREVRRGPVRLIVERRAGWPMRSMGRIDTDNPGPGAISIHPANVAMGMPTFVLWRGLAINTTIFAAALFIVLIAVRLLREYRRLIRGRCPECGHDLRGRLDRGCPECGWGRPVETSAG